MEKQLVQQKFIIDDTSFDCWVIEIEDDKFWFKAHDIAVFLDYKDTDQAISKNVPDEHRKQWVELESRLPDGVQTPPYLKPHTVMISEGGLYRLICGSKKPEAIKFEKRVFDEVLPALRRRGQYKLREQLAIKDRHISELIEKVAVMTLKDETKHVFQLYKHRFMPNKYIFLRPQSRNLSHVIRVVNLEVYELLINEINVPNSMNILNRVKEKLRNQNIFFTDSNNKLTVDVDIPEMVRELIKESLQ